VIEPEIDRERRVVEVGNESPIPDKLFFRIGEVADLEATRLDEVHAFFQRYYHPANASIAVAGDVAPEEALRLVDRYFGEIPPGEAVTPVQAHAELTGDTRIMFEDRVELPRL